MTCKLKERDQFFRELEADHSRLDCVTSLLTLVEYRRVVLEDAWRKAGEYMLVSSVLCCAMERAMDNNQLFTPNNLMYQGLSRTTKTCFNKYEECSSRFHRRFRGLTRGELADRLLPLDSKKNIGFAVESLKALNDVLLGNRYPPVPATPPPAN